MSGGESPNLTKMLCLAKADVARQVGDCPSPVRLVHEKGLQDCWQVLALFPQCYMAPDITLQIARMLVAAQTDINWADMQGQTALHHHAAAGRFEAANCLVQLNAMIDKQDIEGKAPIDLVPQVTHEWLLLLGFVKLTTSLGDDLILPISELTLQDIAHSVRAFVQEHYERRGKQVSYFMQIVMGNCGYVQNVLVGLRFFFF